VNRYITDEQRDRRLIFKATLRAEASWLFFRVARSTRMFQISALRSRLEKQPADLRRHHYYLRDCALPSPFLRPSVVANPTTECDANYYARYAESGHTGRLHCK
jgi:hypothetical protein